MNETIQIGMADNKEDFISKYMGKNYPALEKKPHLVKGETEYKAVTTAVGNRRSPRFQVVTARDVPYGCSYAHLVEWVSPAPGLLIITMTSRIFVIEGKNLRRIHDLLLTENVTGLHEYNAAFYNAPDPEEPLIEKITIEEK